MLTSALFLFVFSAAATHQGSVFPDSTSGFSSDFPSPQDPVRFATDFIFPFMLIATVLQRGLEMALMATTDGEESRQRVRMYSLVMALAAVGMMVPTKFFSMINNFSNLFFGTSFYIVIGLFGLFWLYILYKAYNA